MKRANFLWLLSILLLQWGCYWGEPSVAPGRRPYYKPVYASFAASLKVEVQPHKPLENPGRIYLKDDLLIINERYRGFHLIDNADPANPKPLIFLEVPGALNMAMEGQYLYANNLTDLVTIDLGNLQQIKEVGRKRNLFPDQQHFPPQRGVSFECADASKGIILAWEAAENPGDAKCWR